MKYTENAINVMVARTYKGIGRAWIVKNLTNNKTEKEIVALLNKSSKEDCQTTLDDFDRKKITIKNLLITSKDFIDGVVAIGDSDFPLHRGIVKNSERPVFLFYRGNLSLLNAKNDNIAVIGLLNPDEEIEKIERNVVAKLIENGVTIVSGLAFGCDTIAHRQALDSKGHTVAILPSPLNNILPVKNKGLANKIVENDGLLITEYLTDTKSKRELGGRYQERDRLQALFSNSIVLSASYAKNDLGNDSGSRLAMGYALNYSIQRAVIYDSENNSNNPKYDLNRQIIEEDPNSIIINQHNAPSTIKKLIMVKSKIVKNQPDQQGLF
ncbi:MAG TPA: DNA-binding protein [Flavobacteriaceae bacterium]|nr:DNA-binding protein [Flavobacteriaceae bacterium]